MRSRYSAFVLGKVDYLFDTHHPGTRSSVERSEVERWSTESEWLGLEILQATGGAEEDEEGEVEFIARYRDRTGRRHDHHERSIFKRVEGRWYFFDASGKPQVPSRRDTAKVGRNDPCPCGSGKKYKKCHGRPGS